MDRQVYHRSSGNTCACGVLDYENHTLPEGAAMNQRVEFWLRWMFVFAVMDTIIIALEVHP